MVLILSEEQDETTNDVIDWLWHHGKEVVRINREDDVQIDEIDTEKFIIRVGDIFIDSRQISSFWYRRGPFRTHVNLAGLSHLEIFTEVKAHLSYEMDAAFHQIYRILERKEHITSFFTKSVNKVDILTSAEQVGLNIPATLVTTKKERLLEFFHTNERVICKPLDYPLTFEVNGHRHMSYTEELTSKDIEQLPDIFFPTLFQRKVEKRYEVRTFNVKGKCYSMAIFSQGDEQTAVDFRKYNWSKPNRTVPFRLPEQIEKSLVQLCTLHSLNTGSADFLVDKKGDFYFLEINPVGQFGMVSFPCNYFLEKTVAEHLP